MKRIKHKTNKQVTSIEFSVDKNGYDFGSMSNVGVYPIKNSLMAAATFLSCRHILLKMSFKRQAVCAFCSYQNF